MLKDVILHILPGLSFDVILGFPCIRKNNLVHIFPYLFSESNLQAHNCTKCRQCLPKVFQQERAPSDGKTQPKVLLAVPCVDALNLLREPSVLDGSVAEARRSGCTTGHASTPKGLIGDRENQRPCAGATALDTGNKVVDSGSSVVEARRSGCTSGYYALTPRGLIGDRENQRPCAGATTRDYRCCGWSSEERLSWRSCVGPTGADKRPKGERPCAVSVGCHRFC
jgi:hypothetical protein